MRPKRYNNASELLPEELLKELQKYASGQTLYIPNSDGRKQWGESSGARSFYRQRNEEIRQKYLQKVSIARLADEYCLSEETVRKIVFR